MRGMPVNLCIRSAVAVLAAFTMAPAAASAQTAAATGSIGGEVLDPQERLVTSAQISVHSVDQAFTRAAQTDAAGRFLVAALPPGNYTISVKAAGFEMRRPARVVLNLDTRVRLTLKLGIAAVQQRSTVTAGGPTQEGNTVPQQTNTQESALTSSLAGLTLTYLPSRSRDLTQVTEYTPGVVQLNLSQDWVVAGQRPGSASGTVDGAAFKDLFDGGLRGAANGLPFFPQTAVREVEIVEAGASADVGSTGAGFLNVSTKSGTNKRRGEAFYIGRPSTLSGADAFGHSLHNQQHLFGGSMGGPIHRDRSFFYAGVEQDILDLSTFTQFAPQRIALPSSLDRRQGEVVGRAFSTALFGRVDTVLTPHHLLTAEFNYNHLSASDQGNGSSRILATRDNLVGLHGDSVWLRAGLTSSFGSALVNQALAQWSRDARRLSANSTAPASVINGFGTLGGNSLDPQNTIAQRREITDDLTLTRSSTVLQAGATFTDAPAFQDRVENRNGRYDYTSLDSFLAGRPRRFQQTLVTGSGTYDEPIRILGLYALAKVPLLPSLTLSAGLRWDGQWNPQPNANATASQSRFIPNDLTQWQPRLGLAWNPGKRTTLRAASGLLDAPTPGSFFQPVFTRNGFNTASIDSYVNPGILSLVNGSNALGAQPAGSSGNAVLYGVDPGFRNPRSLQTTLGVQQQLSSATQVSLSYLHASTWKLDRIYDRNVAPPTVDATGNPIFLAARPNPSIGRLLINEASAHSRYDGLLVTANTRLSQRSFITANYTYAKSRDDDSTSDPYGRQSALNPFSPAGERAPSAFDLRHNLNINAILNLPLGFKANPLFLAMSGLPYTPIVGFDRQGDGNDFNDRALLNGSVAARNSLRQPALYNLDLRFVKDFTLPGEGHHLDLFLDVFNLTGAANRNFGRDGVSVYGSAEAPVFSAAQPLFTPIATMFGSPRQVQFTARLVGF